MAKPMLYSRCESTSSWRVRIALAYKAVEYEYACIGQDLASSGEAYADFKKLNPLGQVPCLVIDGVSLTQSVPIIEYLDETRPGRSLLPKDPVQKAKARGIAEIINSGIQPLQNTAVALEVGRWCKDASKNKEWCRHWIGKRFKALEELLHHTAGTFCLGDQVTIADVFLVPQVYNAVKYEVDLSEYPIICGINEKCRDLDFFISAEPINQPDYCPTV